MFEGIDAIMLVVGVALLGASSVTAWLTLKREAKRQRRKAQNATAEAATLQLQEWRRTGILVMSDEDFRIALEFEKYKPGHLHRLVRTIRRITKEAELEPDEGIQFTVKYEYDNEPQGVAGGKSSKRHLELTAEFA